MIKGKFGNDFISSTLKNLRNDLVYFIQEDSELDSISKKSEILISYGDGISGNLVNVLPNLKWIHVLSAGMNMLPLEQIKLRKIKLTNVGGIHKVSMAEYTIAMILNATHRLYHYYDLQQRNEWESWIDADEVSKKTVGIFGVGKIGSEIAKYASNLNMNVIGCRTEYWKKNPYVSTMFPSDKLDNMLKLSDFVVICTPLTSKTKNLFNLDKFKKMKKSAFIINIARGQIINESDLLFALENKMIAGAILDITTVEPLPEDDPLWNAENIIITPHISGRSPYYLDRAFDIFYKNYELYCNKKIMINEFDFNKGY